MLWLTAALAWDPTPKEQDLVRALSHRDGAPPCADLADRVDDPVVSYTRVIEHVQYPPWAPMRAAICLIEHHEAEAEPLLLGWVTDPSKKGLAKLVFHRTHLLEAERAERIERAALAGPLATEARRTK